MIYLFFCENWVLILYSYYAILRIIKFMGWDMSKKVLKNKDQVFKKGVIALLISSGVVSAVGLGGFVYFNKEYNNIQKEIDNKVAEIISTEGYIAYQEKQEEYLYELYKNGDISSKEFDERVSDLSTAGYIINNDNTPVSDEDRGKLIELENEKLSPSLAVLGSTVAFVGGGTVAFAGGSAYLDNKDKDNEMSD
jgi:hypothetical protein